MPLLHKRDHANETAASIGELLVDIAFFELPRDGVAAKRNDNGLTFHEIFISCET